MSDDRDDNFLSRWSQRKRAVARAEQTPPPAPEKEAEDETFDLSLLPNLEDLTADSDLSLFLKKGVPAALRNAAMKKIWSLDPAIRDRVGDALDYAWDWNAPGGVPGGGALPPDFDAKSMVAKIFGDEPADENVIADAAPQQVEPALAHDAKRTAPASVEKPDEIAHAQTSSTISDSAQPAAAPQKPRRHGSALPS